VKNSHFSSTVHQTSNADLNGMTRKLHTQTQEKKIEIPISRSLLKNTAEKSVASTLKFNTIEFIFSYI